MDGHITLSIWLFAALPAVAVWAVLDRVLIPSTRWFLRRRINRVIEEISTRLDIQIKPFQLTKRQVLIDRVIEESRIETVLNALNMLKLRRSVVECDGIYSAVPEAYDVLSYYANSIGNWIPAGRNRKRVFRQKEDNP
jgi:glycerol-3-phosphate O-acyltransferase